MFSDRHSAEHIGRARGDLDAAADGDADDNDLRDAKRVDMGSPAVLMAGGQEGQQF